jgi:predicted nucleic acid-binding protein
MVPERCVLDSSAIFSLIEEEEGAARVAEIIREGGAILPFVVLLEVAYVSQQELGVEEASRRYSLMRQFPCELIWEVDEPTLVAAADFKARHGISLADALIAAYAQTLDAVLLHKDPELESLADDLALEALPYKIRVN